MSKEMDEASKVAAEVFAEQEPRPRSWTYDLNVDSLAIRAAFIHAIIAMTLFFAVRYVPNYSLQLLVRTFFPIMYFSCVGWFGLVLWAEWHKRGVGSGKDILQGPMYFIKHGSEEVEDSFDRSLVISKTEKVEPKHIVKTIVDSMLPEVQKAVEESELLELVTQAMNKMLPPCKERIIAPDGKVEYRDSRYELWRWYFPDTPVMDPYDPDTVFDSCLLILHPQYSQPDEAFDRGDRVKTHFGYYESKTSALRSQIAYYRWFVPTGEYLGVVGLPRAIRYTMEQVPVEETVLRFLETTSLMQQQQTLTSALVDKIGERTKSKKILGSKLRMGAGLDSAQSVLGGPKTGSEFLSNNWKLILFLIVLCAVIGLMIWLGIQRAAGLPMMIMRWLL